MSGTITRAELLRALERIPPGRLDRLLEEAYARAGRCDICDAETLGERYELCPACDAERVAAERADAANDGAKAREGEA